MYGPQVTNLTLFKQGGGGKRSLTRATASYRMGSKSREIPLPYSLQMSHSYRPSDRPSPYWDDSGDAPNCILPHMLLSASPPTDMDNIRNRAIGRFVQDFKGGTDAALGTTLAEWSKSSKMIALRASQLLESYRSFRKGDFGRTARILRIPREDVNRVGKPGIRQAQRDVSSQWLELHFGWTPLIKDVYSAVNVLQGPLPGVKARGRASGVYWVDDQETSYNSWHTSISLRSKVLIGADVYLENPNLALANRMGLVNPATVVWELIPFSFLVDWFIPVGKFLNSMTDYVGYQVRNGFTTTTHVGWSQQRIYYSPSYAVFQHADVAFVSRVLGVPPARLAMTPFKGLSVARGATAIALVIQQFLKP